MRIMDEHGKEEEDKMKIVGGCGEKRRLPKYVSMMRNGAENEDDK
ncbi:MAG: hypothetical protein QMC80_02840 [Thermoplasmatales archaeon]|nr:hypothetical protein [Thermoplasmatales archaeon]